MFTKASLVLSLCASCASAAFVPPARLDVPVVLSGNGRPIMGVTMVSFDTVSVAPLQGANRTFIY